MKPDTNQSSEKHPLNAPRRLTLATAMTAAALIIFAAVLIYMAASASRERRTAPDIEEKTQILLPVIIGGGDASWENCIRQVAADYMEAHPQVLVEVRTILNIENVDYPKGLIIEEALGNFNGVVEMRTAEAYAAEGKLAPIPEHLTERFKQVQRYGGAVYSLPRYYSCRGIIYNRSLFEQYDIKVPETYPEFLTVCGKLKSLGVTPLTIGAGDLWHMDHWCSGLFSSDVLPLNPDWIRKRNAGSVHWTDEEPTRMLKDFLTLFQNHYVDPDFASTTDAQTIEMLTEGKAAMLYSGTWLFSQILKTDPQFDIGWFFLPGHETEPPVELNGAWEWAVTSSCLENDLYDTAVDFLEYYYSQDAYRTVLQNMNGFSSLKETVSYPAIPVQEEIARIAQAKGTIPVNTLEMGETPEGFTNMLYLNMLRMAKGEQTLGETAAILDKEWDKRIEQNQ